MGVKSKTLCSPHWRMTVLADSSEKCSVEVEEVCRASVAKFSVEVERVGRANVEKCSVEAVAGANVAKFSGRANGAEAFHHETRY